MKNLSATLTALLDAVTVKIKSYVDSKISDIDLRMCVVENRGTFDDIEILAEIDPEKSYKKGTWAIYKGGLVRSDFSTIPLKDCKSDQDVFHSAGWRVVVRGVDSVSVELDIENKYIGIKVKTTDGSLSVEDDIPLIIDKGVWKSSDYTKGDCVSHRGCMWIAQRNTKESDRPGVSDGWRLAVKKGRDGKREESDASNS